MPATPGRGKGRKGRQGDTATRRHGDKARGGRGRAGELAALRSPSGREKMGWGIAPGTKVPGKYRAPCGRGNGRRKAATLLLLMVAPLHVVLPNIRLWQRALKFSDARSGDVRAAAQCYAFPVRFIGQRSQAGICDPFAAS